MNRVLLVNYFFVFYLIVTILNLNVSFDLILGSSSFSALLYYSSIVSILISFLISLYKPSKEVKFIFGKIFKFILFFFTLYLLSFISGLISENFKYLEIYIPIVLKSSLMLVLFSWLFSYLLVHNQIENYIKWLTIIVLFSIFSIPFLKYLNIEISYFLYDDLLNDEIGRASGVFGNANIAAQYCVIGIILILYNLNSNTKIFYKIILILILLIIYYSLYLTFSNTGFLNAIIIIIFFFIVKSKKKVYLFFKVVIAFILFQVFLISFLHNFLDVYYVNNKIPLIQQDKIDNFINLIDFTHTSNERNVDYSFRDELASEGWKKINENPLIGSGLGSFSVNLKSGVGIHNSYLQVIGETGILVFIIYMFIFFNFIYNQIYQNKLDELNFLVSAILFSILIYMLTSHDVLYSERLLLFLVFIEIIFLNKKYFRNNKVYFGKQ